MRAIRLPGDSLLLLWYGAPMGWAARVQIAPRRRHNIALALQYCIWYYDKEDTEEAVRADPIIKEKSRKCALTRPCQCSGEAGKVSNKN